MAAQGAHRTEGSYGAFHDGVVGIATDAGIGFDDALVLVCAGWSPLAISLRCGVAVPVVAAKVADSAPSRISRVYDMLPPPCAPNDAVMAALFAGRTPFATARAVLAWREAGRPGQQPTAHASYESSRWSIMGRIEDARDTYDALRPYLADSAVDFDAFAAAVLASSSKPTRSRAPPARPATPGSPNRNRSSAARPRRPGPVACGGPWRRCSPGGLKAPARSRAPRTPARPRRGRRRCGR